MTLAHSVGPPPLAELVEQLEAVAGFSALVSGLHAGYGASLDGVWGSSCALAAAALSQHAPAELIVVSPHPGDVDDLVEELKLFSSIEAEVFSALESLDSSDRLLDSVRGERISLLKRLMHRSAPKIVVTSIQALLQGAPDRAELARSTKLIRQGDDLAIEPLLKWLVQNRFQRQSGVELPGEFSLHGGILDLYAPDWPGPVRLELFGDTVESIRRFEVATQRSLATLEEIELTASSGTSEERAHLADYLSPKAWFLLIEPTEIDLEGRHSLERSGPDAPLHSVASVLARAYQFATVTAEGVSSASAETHCHVGIESVERFSGEISKVRGELESIGAGQHVRIVCQTTAESGRLTEIFAETELARSGRLEFLIGRLRTGFRLVAQRQTLLTSHELFNRTDVVRPSRRRWARVIDSFLDLREGDYVVHVGHGIARYLGLKLLEKGTQVEEHLELEFREGTKLYVPAARIELVQKYIGGTKHRPTLAKLGGRSWGRQKQLAEAAVADLALDMLELQAARSSRPGIRFPIDSDWQLAFDASFPYEETPDQLHAIDDVKGDMQSERPMDRLICGDVGYGKTEVAIRAAFKAIDAGYQVAVLVPTTILAEQHRRTFSSRMAEFPFTVAALSRFLTRKQQAEVVERVEQGSLDLVVGTHRLVQSDVKFKNLGLIIIDEEQRFGVEAKERLKALRAVVDVLTLTATPIPRTLHMSLLGLRDISNLETPPAERISVETRVTRFEPDLVRHAILRELNREGQVYFVHNRVHDIEVLAKRLRQIVPEARVAIGHGQMPEHELEEVMVDFVNHRHDVLLSTTIIESGLDIPNANTIFIDQADIYGLADLHQLRGRVGRYKHRAYCYMLVDPGKALAPAAAKRLRAIEEFSEIGAGFAISMRDLEIRGAGNILGTQQSGHIAAVGYELYCELLEKAVRRLKNLPPRDTVEVNFDLPVEAFLPREYVSDLRQKIDLYRRLSRVVTEMELEDLAAEILDRFGPRPPAVERLLDVSRIRVWAHAWQITQIMLEDPYVVFRYASRTKIEKLAARGKGALRVVDSQSAYLHLGKELADFDAVFRTLKSLLRP